mgnify:CR=1 FL=1
MTHRKISAAAASILFISAVFSGCVKGDEQNAELQAKQESIRVEAQQYEQETNEDGIAVDLSDNPYFMTEQEGFEYSEPETITYSSEVTGTERHANVLLPADYDESKEYPVLYLLHGLDGSHRTWKNKNGHIIIQNLHYLYGVPEMIVVCPNSSVNEKEDTDGLDIHGKVAAYDLTEEDIVTSLMPYINSHYSVKQGRENTAIAGNSMGGRNALYTAFKHQDLFGYVGAFSSAHVLRDETSGSILSHMIDDFTVDPQYGGFQMIMVCVGRQDNVCGGESYKIHENMTKNGVEHIFYDMEGGHENSVWQNNLYNFGKRLFQPEA